jgi:hypothetical protein
VISFVGAWRRMNRTLLNDVSWLLAVVVIFMRTIGSNMSILFTVIALCLAHIVTHPLVVSSISN